MVKKQSASSSLGTLAKPQGDATPAQFSLHSATQHHIANAAAALKSRPIGSEKRAMKTRIAVKYDVGFSNILYIRGKGANLSWDKGIPLKNIGPDEWIWETDALFTIAEFKVLINDERYEEGANHLVRFGTSIQFTPQF